MRWFFAALFFFLTCLSVSADTPMRLPVDARPLVFSTSHGPVSLDVEIADDNAKRMQGLMFRTDLPHDRGMLFVFDETRLVTMWMRNTPLSLDMVFLNKDGTIATIREHTVPFSENIISSDVPVDYVVELRAGTAKKLGLKVGTKVVHPAICGTCAD